VRRWALSLWNGITGSRFVFIFFPISRSSHGSLTTQLDNMHAEYQQIRAQRIRDRGHHLIKTLPARDGLMTSGSAAGRPSNVDMKHESALISE
jgi:hypothetical protein